MVKIVFSDLFAHVGESFGMSSFPISSKPLTTSLAFCFYFVLCFFECTDPSGGNTALSIVLFQCTHDCFSSF